MAGHLARNQVHAGSIPAALTEWGARRGGATPCKRRRTGSTPVLSTDWVSAPGRAVGLQSRRTAFESLLTRNADRMASVTSLGMTPRPTTSSASWKAPPNGRQRVPKTRVVALSPRGSIPPPSSTFVGCSPAPLSERLGPGLPNRRREFDSRTVLKPGGPRQLGGEPASRAAIVPQKR